MEAIQYIVFVQVLLACCCAASTTTTETSTTGTSTIPATTTATIKSTSTTASSTATPPSITETPSTSTTILTSTTITTTPTDGLTSTPAASTSTSPAETTTVKPQTTSTIKTTSSTVEETQISPQGTTQSTDHDSTTTLSNPTTITITTQTAITTATEQFPSNYSLSTEVATMTPTTQTNLTSDNMTSTSRSDQSTPYSTSGKSTGFAGTTEHPAVLTTSTGTNEHPLVSTTTAGTSKPTAESTTTAGTTANTLYEKQVIINLRKDIDALEKENSLFVYIIIGLAVALGVVLMTTVICCVYCSGRQGNASIDDGIDNDIKTSAYVRTRRPFGSISNDVVHLFSRATRRFSGRDSRENQLNSQPRHTFTNKLAEEDNEETEKVSEEKDTTKSAELVELKEVTEVQTEVVNETVVDGGISRNQPAFASLKNGDTNSKLQKSQPCVVPIPTVPTVPIGEAIVAMDNGEVDKETDDNTKDTVSKTDQSAEAANSDKTIAVTLRSDIEVENVISCRVDDRAMSEVDLSDQNEIPLPPPLADNGQQSEQGVDVSVAN